MTSFRSTSVSVLVLPLALACSAFVAGCGGGGDTSSASAVGDSTSFRLAKASNVGLRNAWVTFTKLSDEKTTTIVELTVVRTAAAADDVYSVRLDKGSCEALGAPMEQLGDATNGSTTLVLDKSYDDLVQPVKDGSATLVITKDKGQGVAWCGATVDSGLSGGSTDEG